MIGEVVDGYEIVRSLGMGGMGEVYLAHGPGGARAIKLVRADHVGPEATARFRREALALERLAHPAIVRILDAGRLPTGALYLGMEYVAGPDLQAAVDRHGPYPVTDALAILVQLASALGFAHGAGIVHRDLKPANVLLAEGDPERAKVIDFGLAKIAVDQGLTRLTHDEQVLGSPLYCAPEQTTTADVGPAADIYALGGLAYFVLSGVPMFPNRPSVALAYAHQHEVPPALSARCAGLALPPGLDELIAACVAKDPAARPAAAQVLAELEELRTLATDAVLPRRRRLFSEPGTNDLEQALKSQIRQVVLDLATTLAVPVDDVDALQGELSDLELELAMLDADLETAVDDREALAARRDGLAAQIEAKRRALVAAFDALYERASASRTRSSTDARELFEELDALEARVRTV